jgi:FMN phosphatase YigB (HAD superfamily)
VVLEAVTFDFWETLCTAPGGGLQDRRRDLVCGAVAEAGGVVEPELVVIALEAAWTFYETHWHANSAQVTGAQGAEVVADRLVELAPDLAKVRSVIVDTFVRATEETELELVPGVAEVLGELAERRVPVGIVCDVGLVPSWRLRAELERHGVLHRFAHWSFSDEVGVFKPDARIFRHALDGLGGVEPGRAAHVGDIRRTDIAGAQAMGMRAIRFAGINDDTDETTGPEADAVVRRYPDLLAALGL